MSSEAFLLVSLSSLLLVVAIAFAALWLTPYWDLLAEWQMGALTSRFKQLGMSATALKTALRAWGAITIGVFCLLWIVMSSAPLAIVMTFLAYVAPRHVLDILIRRRSLKLRRQLVGACVGIGNAVRAGLSLPQSIDSVCEVTEKPLVDELRRITFRFNRGRTLRAAIADVRVRLNLEPFTLFANAIDVAQERGGNLSEVLERISISLQELQRLEQKVEADTSAGRQAVLLLSIFPLGFLAFFAILDIHSVSLLFTNFAGQCVLACVIMLIYAGTRWASKIVNIEV